MLPVSHEEFVSTITQLYCPLNNTIATAYSYDKQVIGCVKTIAASSQN